MNEELKNVGLYGKYTITKTSGNPIDENAEYFVLRLDRNGDDMEHIKACRLAINVYAQAIKNHLPLLAQDLIERYPMF